MDINETIIFIAAASFELGIPILLVYFSHWIPSKQYLWLSMLGAILPAIFVIVFITFGYFFIDSEEYNFAFAAIWAMGFFAYCLLLFFGYLVGFIMKKWLKPLQSFVLCIFIGPLLVFGIMFLENLI